MRSSVKEKPVILSKHKIFAHSTSTFIIRIPFSDVQKSDLPESSHFSILFHCKELLFLDSRRR